MTEHKLTDEEVIKALECCRTAKIVTMKFFKCDRPLKITTTEKEICLGDVIDLINRQKAEIERLTTLAELGRMRANDYRDMRDKAKIARAEAIKEFAERLKEMCDDPYFCVWMSEIDDLMEEMTEEKE